MILPDANLLVAFTWENHQHQAAAVNFFQKHPRVATCPLTELALVRIWMQKGASGADADRALKDFVSQYRSRLIPDDLSATAIAGLSQGHRQTTDSSRIKSLLAHHAGSALWWLGLNLAVFEVRAGQPGAGHQEGNRTGIAERRPY